MTVIRVCFKETDGRCESTTRLRVQCVPRSNGSGVVESGGDVDNRRTDWKSRKETESQGEMRTRGGKEEEVRKGARASPRIPLG